MPVKTWELPWRNEMVPHAVVDVLRTCNISCRACYNAQPLTPPKTLHEVESELDRLLELRRLSSVSILGGEVSLHPQLCDIIKAIRARDLNVEVITNGLEVDEAMCDQLKDAGLNIIYFHVERGQKRADLPEDHTPQDLSSLRRDKATMAARSGLDVGLTVTAYPSEREDVRDSIQLTLEMPEINYLLVTLFRDNSGIKALSGNIYDGFKGEGVPPGKDTQQNNRDFVEWIQNEFGFAPFGSMRSSIDPTDPRWLSYLIGAVYDQDGKHHVAHVTPSLLEKGAVAYSRIVKGRYPMYLEQNPERFQKQLALNALLGGQRASNRDLIERSKAPGARLTAKRLLFQNPAELTADGKLIYCRWCPDAVLKNGSLVPVCIADNVS
jgi:hypothetical protein